MSSNYTLWNFPKEKRDATKRESGLNDTVRDRIERVSEKFQADDINDRLKVFDVKVDEASFFGCRRS